jgi:predicted HAD superfamily Cof-like phosphohydrolase
MKHNLTPTTLSNLLTMGICAEQDARQAIPHGYCMPDKSTRLLRAKLILEEAIETINALGFVVQQSLRDRTVFDVIPSGVPDMEKIIDGCCDEIYVATGTLCAVGAPDGPHLAAVNAANEAKFPGGKVVRNESGKFLKPEGWLPPDHNKVMWDNRLGQSLKDVSDRLVKRRKAQYATS